MRLHLIACAVFLMFLGLPATTAVAQEAGASVSVTGCLVAEEDDGETEYMLESFDAETVPVDEIELMAAEGVDLAPHVGHTVEASGVVVDVEGESDESELQLSVTALGHVAASCDD